MEVKRQLSVLDVRLADCEFVSGSTYSIADMAVWPWASLWEGQEQILDGKPNLAAWLERVANRPAVQKGRAHYAELRSGEKTIVTEEIMLHGPQIVEIIAIIIILVVKEVGGKFAPEGVEGSKLVVLILI